MSITASDVSDRQWLHDRLTELRTGVEAANAIWTNWSSNRNVSRFAEGLAYGDYIRRELGYPLAVEDAIRAMPGASTRQIAAVAGVSQPTVIRSKAQVKHSVSPAPSTVTPTKVLGSDGKSYPAQKQKVTVKGTTPTPIAQPIVIAGLPTPAAPQPPSQLVIDAIRLLKQVAALDATAVSAAQTAEQHQSLRRAAERAGKVCEKLARPLLIFP